MRNRLVATGKVEGLCLNGAGVEMLNFSIYGPVGDKHTGLTRRLSGHDGDYIRNSNLLKGDTAFNWRSWTALSQEEVAEIESSLRCSIPQGCLLENLTISGIPNFSKLAPTTRLVFPKRQTQTVLAVWEENSPCHTVGLRLEVRHGVSGLKTKFIAAAQNKRGVMGFVLSPGRVDIGDSVEVYAPV